MALNSHNVSTLRRIIRLAEKLIEKAPTANRHPAKGKRARRSGKELVQFRKMLKTERAGTACAASL